MDLPEQILFVKTIHEKRRNVREKYKRVRNKLKIELMSLRKVANQKESKKS